MTMNRREITNVEEIKETKRNGVTRRSSDKGDTMFDMRSILKPMLYSLVFCGCYRLVDISVNPNNSLRRKRTNCLTSLIYRLILLVILLSYIAKTIVAFFYLIDTELYFNAMAMAWIGMCMLWFLLFWKASSARFGNQTTSFQMWDKTILPKFKEMNLEYPIKKVKRIVSVFATAGLMIAFTNIIGIGIQFALTETASIYTSPFEINGLTIPCILLAALVCSLLWTLPTMYILALAFVLKYAFQTVTKAIGASFCSHGCTVPPDFQKLRILHNCLCTLVSEFDKDFRWLFGSLCTVSIFVSCLALYCIVRLPLDAYTMCLFLFWMVSCLAMLGLQTCFAAMVNTEAHASLDTIYYINVNNVTCENLAQINLFLSRLTGTQVGFSTCGLLVITKEFILTIVGLFLTYFAVLYTL